MLGTQALCACLVGVLWGSTNPLVRRGSLVAAAKAQTSRIGSLLAHLTTPAFIVPQALNQCGSALFIYLLGVTDISTLVPVANAVSILFTALADLALGERYQVHTLLPGLLLLSVGVLLCGLQ